MNRILNEFFSRLTLPYLVLTSAALVLFIGFLDFVTGYEINFFVFYAIPIWLASWYGNRKIGWSFAVLCALVWFFVDHYSGSVYINPVAPYWNSFIRFSVFVFFVYSLSNIKAKLKLESLHADHDVLTHLLNARGFKEKLNAVFPLIKRENQLYSLAFIDLDNFKKVNDSMGHAEGDRVLKTVALTMQDSLRKSDVVSRLGGDEFVVFFPNTNITQAKKVVTGLKDRLDSAVKSHNWPVGFSVGVCVFESSETEIDSAISIADTIMYEVKNSGKGKVSFKDFTKK